MHILLGNVAPIEMKRRDTSSLQTREEMLILAREIAGEDGYDVDSLSDDDLREFLAECRVPVELETVNGQSITEFQIPDDTSVIAAVSLVSKGWVTQSTEPPAWVVVDGNTESYVAGLIASELGAEDIRECPEGWMVDSEGKPPRPLWTGFTIIATLTAAFLLIAVTRMQLRTNGGRDFQSSVMGNGVAAGAGTGAMRPANYLAISTDGTAPALGDTTLTGELTTGGLARAQAAYAHTAASTTYTLIYEWTSSDGTPRIVQKMGVFNASTAGILVFESLVPSAPNLTSGDKLEITSTIDIA